MTIGSLVKQLLCEVAWRRTAKYTLTQNAFHCHVQVSVIRYTKAYAWGGLNLY